MFHHAGSLCGQLLNFLRLPIIKFNRNIATIIGGLAVIHFVLDAGRFQSIL
jgi:hypothetical protein